MKLYIILLSLFIISQVWASDSTLILEVEDLELVVKEEVKKVPKKEKVINTSQKEDQKPKVPQVTKENLKTLKLQLSPEPIAKYSQKGTIDLSTPERKLISGKILLGFGMFTTSLGTYLSFHRIVIANSYADRSLTYEETEERVRRLNSSLILRVISPSVCIAGVVMTIIGAKNIKEYKKNKKVDLGVQYQDEKLKISMKYQW